MPTICTAMRPSPRVQSASSNGANSEQILPTGLPTGQRQYDQTERKAREIKKLMDSTRAHTNGARVRFWHKADLAPCLLLCPLSGQRWGNRPAFLWIAERFGVLRFRLMVKRGPCMRPQASEGEAQHGLFCWTRRVGPGDERLHCG